MAKITKISTQKRKGRYNIFLDGHYAWAVTEDVLIKYHLAKGQELDPAIIQQIQETEQYFQAYNQALNYLSYQLRSVAEVREHLQTLEYDNALIQQVIAQLSQQQYLNDQQYADSFVRTAIKISLDGPGKITRKLQRKKVAAVQIQQSLTLFTPALMEQNAVKLAQKVQKQARNQSYQAILQKIKKRLQTAGYPVTIVTQALAQLDLQPDLKHEQQLLAQTGQKLWRRYQKQTNGRQKLYAALARRGFNSGEISNFLQELN